MVLVTTSTYRHLYYQLTVSKKSRTQLSMHVLSSPLLLSANLNKPTSASICHSRSVAADTSGIVSLFPFGTTHQVPLLCFLQLCSFILPRAFSLMKAGLTAESPGSFQVSYIPSPFARWLDDKGWVGRSQGHQNLQDIQSHLRLVAHTVKNLPAMRETPVWSLGWEDTLEKGMTTHFSIFAYKISWTDYQVAKSRTQLSH